MKRTFVTLTAIIAATLNMQAQPPADSTPTYPSGATKVYSSGTNTLTGRDTQQFYTILQCGTGDRWHSDHD